MLAAPTRLPTLVFGPGTLPTLWARVGGCIAVTFGAYYAAIYAADAAAGGKETTAVAFYRATVWARAALAAALAACAIAHAVPGVGILAAANAIGALSMAVGLRKDGQRMFGA